MRYRSTYHGIRFHKKKVAKERLSERLLMIESESSLSISRQCDLLNISRSSYYYKPIPETEFNLLLMREIDKQYLLTPAYGSRLMTGHLRRTHCVNRKRIIRLMKDMNIEAIYPKPKIRTTQQGYEKFPYLLKGLEINAPNLVWATDITYIPVQGGYFYLVAFLDLYSRFVLSHQFSNSLESVFCIEALQTACEQGKPQIVNSDQGVQYTSHAYIDKIKSIEAKISMSGKGKCWDNIFIERFWRTLKYEEVFLKQYDTVPEAIEEISTYIELYNYRRPHSALNYRTPAEIYLGN